MCSEIINDIVSKEWEMFHGVNGDGPKASCQENPTKFFATRKAQFLSWPEEVCELYLKDVNKAIEDGRSLVEEKYIRMMEYTFPDEYEQLKQYVPELSEEKKKLCREMCDKLVEQSRAVRKQYPFLSQMCRPLTQAEAMYGVSYEVYQLCEFESYSMDTLKGLKAYIDKLDSEGISFAEIVQKNNAVADGFANIDEAEHAAKVYLSEIEEDE